MTELLTNPEQSHITRQYELIGRATELLIEHGIDTSRDNRPPELIAAVYGLLAPLEADGQDKL